MTSPSPDSRAESLLRELAPQVLGCVVGRYGDFAAAEDAVQEALIAAAVQWPRDGLPENPRGWLIQVASRRITDRWRSEAARRSREEAAARDALLHPAARVADAEEADPGDDTLLLLFMCCHLSLTTPSAVALTLRAVGGLTTAEIANAFLVPEATMAQRISRAKETIRSSGVAFRMPTREERARRLNAALHTLYLIYSEGYASSAGPTLHRTDLSSEAVRLARALHQVLPDDAEVAALLALMLLTDARRPARTDANGELVPLDEQDRTLWNKEFIAEGVALVSAALPKGRVGPYQIQAAIAAIHDEAARFEETDWPQILAFYQVLERLSNNPIVSLNRIVATAMVEGPKAGLDALDVLAADARLKGHYRLDAVRAHLLEKVGDREAGSTVEAFTMAADSMGADSMVEAFTVAGGVTGAGGSTAAVGGTAEAGMAAETPRSKSGDIEERRFDRKESSDMVINTAGRWFIFNNEAGRALVSPRRHCSPSRTVYEEASAPLVRITWRMRTNAPWRSVIGP